MKKALYVLCVILFAVKLSYSQTRENLKVVEQAMKLNKEENFKALAKMFDTTGNKSQIHPYLLYSAWVSLQEKYGAYNSSKIKTSYIKKNTEYIIQRLEFDSGYVEIKFGFTEGHQIKTYLLQKMDSKADLQLEEKYRMPAYASTKMVEAEKVAFGKAPYILAAELTLPKGLKKGEKVPAVVLVHGSGAGDKDEKTGPQRPFMDIAYGLSSRGIAVIRYDKRTLTYADECSEDKNFTVNDETVNDALEAVKYLATLDNIDATKIVVLGHSLGGMMLPRMLTMDTGIAGGIFMAAPAKRLSDKIIEQTNYLSTLQPDKKKELDQMKEDFVRLQTNWYDSSTNKRYMPFGCGPLYWMDIEGYKQTVVVKRVKKPMLFLQGNRDYQVTEEDFALWKAALDGNSKASFQLFKGLTHNMVSGSGTPHPDDYKIAGNVSQPVIDAISNWVKSL